MTPSTSTPHKLNFQRELRHCPKPKAPKLQTQSPNTLNPSSQTPQCFPLWNSPPRMQLIVIMFHPSYQPSIYIYIYRCTYLKMRVICVFESYGVAAVANLAPTTSEVLKRAQDVLERVERLGVRMRCGVHSGKAQRGSLGSLGQGPH